MGVNIGETKKAREKNSQKKNGNRKKKNIHKRRVIGCGIFGGPKNTNKKKMVFKIHLGIVK